MKLKYAVGALCLLSVTEVSAATFDISFWDTSPSPSGSPPTNINDASLVTKGKMVIKDSAIAANSFVKFSSGDITEFEVSYTDLDGNPMKFDYNTDDTSYFDAADFGALFDANGNFLRFDSPIYSFSNGIVLVDDESPNPGNGFFAAYLEIYDDNDLSVGYLNQEAVFNSSTLAKGDFVDPALFPTSDVTIFSNWWNGTGKDVSVDYSGYISVAKRPGIAPPPSVIPLPAGLPLMAGAFMMFGLLRRRKT